MNLLPVQCYYCKEVIFRSKRQVNESKKFSWKTFCAPLCQSQSKTKKKNLICSNPLCNKSFQREPSAISRNNYCSRSCAVTINNKKYPKIVAHISNCQLCEMSFKRRGIYCSIICRNKSQLIDSSVLIKKIQEFYEKEKRIPLKHEFSHVMSARKQFGSWNKAIIAAGYTPNPVKFAKRWIANDRHECDSLSEKIIDDWLYARKVVHERNVRYGTTNITADFKINNIFVEFIGLEGQLLIYDRALAKKRLFWEKEHIKVIQLYPHNLFPQNTLSEVLNTLVA